MPDLMSGLNVMDSIFLPVGLIMIYAKSKHNRNEIKYLTWQAHATADKDNVNAYVMRTLPFYSIGIFILCDDK